MKWLHLYPYEIQSIPLIWSSDIWSFRLYGQFLDGLNWNNCLWIPCLIWSFRLNGKFLVGQTWTIYTEPTVLLNMACSCRAAALLRASDMNSTSFGIFGPPPPICQQNVLGLLRNSVYLLHSLSVQTSYTEAPNLAADKGNRRCFSLPPWREFKLRLIFAQSHSTTLEVADVGTSGVGTSLLSLHPFRMRRWRCNWRDGECDDSPRSAVSWCFEGL